MENSAPRAHVIKPRERGVEVVRILFGLLIVFEALNCVRVLHFSVVYTWFGLLATTVSVWALMELSHWRRAHHQASWFMAFIAISADASGDMLHFYARIPHFDKYAHFGISMIGTLIILLLPRRHRAHVSGHDYLFALTSIVALGALYELEEFWESALLHSNRWGGGADTLTDMTANAAGALAAALVFFVFTRLMAGKRQTSST